ncbi:MAG: L-rhamnose isomerase [Candidatus Aminicenantes bacterium]|nr:L-rhamnose isomerase [Candidatus Aminicenantes bacterium]
MSETIERRYREAVERYAEIGVDVERSLERLKKFSLSVHCWQGDDVGGFERSDATLSGGGIQVTGSYPGRARTIDQLRQDLEMVYSLLPGKHRLNLHAIYGEFGGKSIDRDAVGPEHFAGWMDWAESHGLMLDFNPTCFSHPLAESGYTLSNKDPGIRKFWMEHVRRCRAIAAAMGERQKSPCFHNIWIPDGAKDLAMDRAGFRRILVDSLDGIFETTYPATSIRDSVESKLFGIGSESFVVGSHEFYLGYALTRGIMICFDMGHFHPTESVADKISAVLPYMKDILLHVSRGVRWDSDHVVLLSDELLEVMREIVRAEALNRVFIALDFFDAGLNRVGAWVSGSRAVLKGLLIALLEPGKKLLEAEEKGDYFTRMALFEETKSLPFGDVWNKFCEEGNVPSGMEWVSSVQQYDKDVTRKREG